MRYIIGMLLILSGGMAHGMNEDQLTHMKAVRTHHVRREAHLSWQREHWSTRVRLKRQRRDDERKKLYLKRRELDLKEREVVAQERKVEVEELDLLLKHWVNYVLPSASGESQVAYAALIMSNLNKAFTRYVDRLPEEEKRILRGIMRNVKKEGTPEAELSTRDLGKICAQLIEKMPLLQDVLGDDEDDDEDQ